MSTISDLTALAWEYLELCKQIEMSNKHLSLILHKGLVISVGYNQRKTHPLASRYGYRFADQHSELSAYVNLPKSIRYSKASPKLTLLNIRFNRFNQMRISHPCPICMGWCQNTFKRIYYSTPSGIVERLVY